jgi:DNA-binding MarR family transcriptional regulator
LFWRAAARVSGALSDVLPVGVDIHAYAALIALAGGATRSQQEISEMISVSRTTMTRVAGDLADQGLVERVRNPDDRRSYALTRTAEGATAARRWRRHSEHVEEAVTPGFTRADREDLRAGLHHLAGPQLPATTPEPLRDSIPFLITRIHAGMHTTFLELLEPLGIEPRHFGTLIGLQASGPVSQAELARILGVSDPLIVQIVDHLEERGLLERRRLAADRRTQMLHLTQQAGPTVDEARRLARHKGDELMASMSRADRERLMDLLRRIVTAP